jgi:hypothetical protein
VKNGGRDGFKFVLSVSDSLSFSLAVRHHISTGDFKPVLTDDFQMDVLDLMLQ